MTRKLLSILYGLKGYHVLGYKNNILCATNIYTKEYTFWSIRGHEVHYLGKCNTREEAKFKYYMLIAEETPNE